MRSVVRKHDKKAVFANAVGSSPGEPAGSGYWHVSTAHRWRHRFLALPEHIQAQSLCGIAEADETVFLLSFKGKRSGLERKARKRGGKASKRGMSNEQVPVLVARDRAGATMDCVLTAVDMRTVSAALKPVLAKDAVLCTDGSRALAAAARDIGVEHHAVNLVFASTVPGTCRTSMRITAVSRAGSEGSAASQRVTCRSISGGSARWTGNRQAARSPRSGSRWRSAGWLNNMICENSLKKP